MESMVGKTLEEFLSDDNVVNHAEGPFVIDSKEKAIWAMRKIAQLTKEISANNDAANNEIMRIEEWREAANKTHRDSIKYFTDFLEVYHRKLYRESNGKQKTIKLPHGELKLRAQEPEYVRNDEALLAYIKHAYDGDFIKVKEFIDWANFKASEVEVKEDGTVVVKKQGEVLERDVLHAVPRGPKFSITVVG